MIGVGLALLVLGIACLFFAPWLGFPLGLVGLALFVAQLAGFGRWPAGGSA